VMMYAPWCGHCKKMKPDVDEAAEAFAKIPEVGILKLDCDNADNKVVCGRYGVTGFPTIKTFEKGNAVPNAWEGGRSAEDIVSGMNKLAGTNARIVKPPSAIEYLTPDTFDARVGKDAGTFAFVKFFAPWCGHCKSLAPVWEKLAATFAGEQDVVIAKVDCDAAENKALCGKYGVTGYPTLKSWSQGAEEWDSYSGARELKDLVAYVNEKAGTERLPGGGLDEQSGRHAELDALVKEFIEASESAREAVIAKAEALVGKLSAKLKAIAKFYVSFMKKVVTRGVQFIETELARIQRIIESGSVGPIKLTSFQKRLNILKAFIKGE